MKLSWGFILSSLYCSTVASKAGHVFIYDPIVKSAREEPEAVSPETARLILAQRLGVSRYHSIMSANHGSILQLGKYAGVSQRLFLGQNDLYKNDAHALVWIEDVDDIGAIIKDQTAYTYGFTMTSPPSSAVNDRLIQDFILQAESLPRKQDPAGVIYEVGIKMEAALKPIKKADTYNDYLSIFRAGKSDGLDSAALSNILDEIVHECGRASRNTCGMTVVLMPPSSSHSKHVANPYGTYDLPASIEARREKTEAPLPPSPSQPSTAPQSPNVSNLETFPRFSQANDDGPVVGILASCFPTMDACVKQTHNCSSHGECKLLHKGESGKDARRRDCYGCACDPTIQHVGEDHGMESKRKVTYWGGPACQKKDVSQPFWLFVGTGVILAFLISGGIGILYSMGSEELPSVIGAGVSGPTRK